uniref:Uncharacterized protein n=1 Tax=Panagrolaimus davidi TaxID=227884 RepID=A0A914QCC9_9BILA
MQSEIKIGDKIENSGKWIWNFKENGNSLGYQICNQFGIKVVFQAIEFGWDMFEGNDYRSHWIANNEIDGNKFLGDFCDTSIREKLCIDWYLSADNTTTSSAQPCPPTSEKAAVDLRFIPKTNLSTSFYHFGEDICFQSIAPLENGEEQGCCYKAGNIDCSFSGGHSQSSHPNNPFKHFSNDILPWILCCYEKDEGICGRYNDKRLCDSGVNYIPPGIALGIGDPHFHTFDDFFYTFNGFGEFWILENSTSQPLAVQARMEPLNVASQKATIFSGFVFSAPNSAKIQIQKSLIRIVDIFIDGQQLDITSPNSLKQFSINGWQLNVAEDYTEIQIGTNRGFSFKITSFKGAFGILVLASPEWKSKTAGLFGNFNGNKSDDLTSKNGTILDPNSSLQEIHENFGLSWAVTPQTSLFTYFGGKNFADFNNLNFTPTFSFNTSAVSNSVQDICKNDWSCLFDYFYTSNLDLANFTLISNQNYENTINILNKNIQMCPILIPPENGYLKLSNYFKDSKANFGCFTNYTLSKTASFTSHTSSNESFDRVKKEMARKNDSLIKMEGQKDNKMTLGALGVLYYKQCYQC